MKRKTADAPKRAAASKLLTVTVTIETPRGSRNKIKYEPAKKMYSLSKILPEGMVFPYDFGFVPRTKADDGDPLDVLVLTDEPLFPGCLVQCRVIGVIELTQEEAGKKEHNDRLIAVAQASLLYADVQDLAGLNGVVLKQVEEFPPESSRSTIRFTHEPHQQNAQRMCGFTGRRKILRIV